MHLYIVRHGQSRANAERVYEGAESPLTARGEEQARFVGKRFEMIPFDAVISSTMLRTRQTADIINEKFRKPIIECGLIQELRRPSILLGASEDSLKFEEISRLLYENADNPDWKHSDEESFRDIVGRGREFLDDFLPKLALERLVVVSHGTFIRFLIGVMMFGDQFTPRESRSLRRFLKTKNTGITWCERSEQGIWALHTWMDHAHLG